MTNVIIQTSNNPEVFGPECKTKATNCKCIRCGYPGKIKKYAALSNAINLVGTPPGSSVESSVRKELVRVGQFRFWIGNALRVIEIMEQDGNNDRFRSFWRKDFVGFKVGHAFIGPCKSAVLGDGHSRCGWCDIRRDDTSVAACNYCTPVLHSFRQS